MVEHFDRDGRPIGLAEWAALARRVARMQAEVSKGE